VNIEPLQNDLLSAQNNGREPGMLRHPSFLHLLAFAGHDFRIENGDELIAFSPALGSVTMIRLPTPT